MNTTAEAKGADRPNFDIPANACDAHIHIFDKRFPELAADAPLPDSATVAEYRPTQQRMGTTRTVIIQPRAYFTDNRVTLDAIAQFGQNNARGIGVLRPQVTDAELQTLHDGGIRGLRFSLHSDVAAAIDFDMIEPLAWRIKELGWHLQLHWLADQIVARSDLLLRLPGTIVFDHLGKLPLAQGTAHPAFDLIERMLKEGRTWMKLSGAYYISKLGPPYADMVDIGRAYVRVAPDRLVWGSDWPHLGNDKANDMDIINLLGQWAPDAADRQRILVDNPQALYGFEASPSSDNAKR